MEPWLEALIARGRQAGTLTYDEVLAAGPLLEAEADRLTEVAEILERHGITLIDANNPEDAAPPPEPPAPDPEWEQLAAEIEAADHLGGRYHRNADFERTLRAGGVPFSDAVTSFDESGAVFDAELIVPGEQALSAWLALRNLVPATGLWPVIKGEARGPAFTGEPEPLDPGARWRAWRERWRTDRAAPMPELTPAIIRADATANVVEAEKVPPTPWTFRGSRGQGPPPPAPDFPDDDREPPEPNFAELFSNAGPFRAHKQGGGHPDYPTFPFVALRLYATAVPWEVFAYTYAGGWNDCPWPDEQLAMLRHWHALCGVEVVSHLGDWYELFVPRPPRSRHEAHRRGYEMSHFGEETFYNYGTYAHPDPIEAVRASHYWYFWWD